MAGIMVENWLEVTYQSQIDEHAISGPIYAKFKDQDLPFSPYTEKS